MKNKIVLWLGMVVLVVAGLYINAVINGNPSNQSTPNQNQTPPLNQAASAKTEVQVAPDFTLTSLNGETVCLSDFRGKNVYLNFWASWCGPCKAEMPDLEKVHREYQDKGLVVLTVNVGESKSTVQKFIDTNQFTFQVLLDPEANKAVKLYKVTSIPVSFFINKEGIIVSKRIGTMTKKQMEENIALLSE